MGVKVTTSGNGKFITSGDQSDAIIDYSIVETASPLSLNDTSGEIPYLSVTGQSNSVQTSSNTHPSSKLLMDNQLTITDSVRGSFTGKVTDINLSSNTVSVTVVSPFDKLNAIKTMPASNGTLKSIIENYLTLAGITSYSVDSSLTENVSFPAWTDNVWNGLKKICIAASIEIYFQSGVLYVIPRGNRSFSISNINSDNLSIQIGQSAKKISITNLNTQWVTNAIVFVYGANSSIEQIDKNEYKEVLLETRVSLQSINQPVYTATKPSSYVDYIRSDSIGTVRSEYPNGFYCFKNNQGKAVPESTVISRGASVKVELTDNPYEIKLKITGPSNIVDGPWSLEFTPISGEVNQPALALTGTGALKTEKIVTIDTGSSIGDDLNEFTENQFIVNNKYAYNAAYYTAQDMCGPTVLFSFNTDKIVEANNQEFGFLPGAIFAYGDSKYRVNSASYDYGQIAITAKQYTTFADFNAKWSGKTFADFNNTMLDPATYPNEYMKYSDLAIIPLMEPA